MALMSVSTERMNELTMSRSSSKKFRARVTFRAFLFSAKNTARQA
jgi:hypothetical protein